MQKLLDAGLAEFDERGFQAVRVDDVVRRAKISHGTFYLYFANKEDLFKALLSDALVDMAALTDEFPVVTRNDSGEAALRRWVSAFCDTYAAHASVIRPSASYLASLTRLFASVVFSEVPRPGSSVWIWEWPAALVSVTRILSQAEIVGEEVWGDGLQLMFKLSEAITQGMTAAAGSAGHETPAGHAELTALALLMMLERINYLLTVEVRLPRDEMVDRLTAIIFAAFHYS